MEWEYLAAIVLILLIIVVMLMFSDSMRQSIMEKGTNFFKKIVPDFLGQ